MILSNKIIKELKKDGYETYFCKDSARDFYLKKDPFLRKYINIATAAPLSKIRDFCKKEKLSCKTYTKINKKTFELIIQKKYIISPFIKISLKNNYASRKFTNNKLDFINGQDYTINSFLYDPLENKTFFYTGADKDIEGKLIKAIKNPHDKITENRMFLLEGGRLLAELGGDWQIEFETFEAIKQRSLEIGIVSVESIRDFFTNLITDTDKPSLAFRFYKNTEILTELLPQLTKGIGLAQSNKSNNLDLFNHIMYTLDSIDKHKPNYEALRWAAIFHDIAKPYTKSYDKAGNVHFFGHDKIGAIFASKWLELYKFDKNLINKVSILCRYHLFDASLRLDDSSILRLVNRVGKEHIFDLLNLREADRYGTGRKDISMKKIDILRNRVKKLLNSS